jgi:hypothetical protein
MPTFIMAKKPAAIKKGTSKSPRMFHNPNEEPSRRVLIAEERKCREGIYRLVKNTNQLTGTTQTAVMFGMTCVEIQQANPYRVMKCYWAKDLRKPFPVGASMMDALKDENIKGVSPRGQKILVPMNNLDDGIVAIRKIAEYLREL